MSLDPIGLPGSAVETLGVVGCPVCQAEPAIEAEAITWFCRQAFDDPDGRSRVLAAGGLCARHWWQVATEEESTRDSMLGTAELERLERQVQFAETSGLDAHRLRAVLREIAAHWLASNHAVDLDADPATAELLLGPELWAAVGQPPSRPAERDGPRLDPAELGHLLDALERT